MRGSCLTLKQLPNVLYAALDAAERLKKGVLRHNSFVDHFKTDLEGLPRELRLQVCADTHRRANQQRLALEQKAVPQPPDYIKSEPPRKNSQPPLGDKKAWAEADVFEVARERACMVIQNQDRAGSG